MLLSRRLNNLSIRNKLRLFTLATCMILTVFFLASVWMSTNRAVQQDVHGELNEAVLQFNHAEQDRLKENLQAGKDVSESDSAVQILASRDRAALCDWGSGMLHRAGLSPKHRTAGDKPSTLDLISLVDPEDKPVGLVAQGKKPCEPTRDETAFPLPQDPVTPEITDWESHDQRMYELVQAPVADTQGRILGRLVVGFQVDDNLAERIVNHAEHQQKSAARGTSAAPLPQSVEVALWHMDGGVPHILGLSGQGAQVSRSFVQSVLQKNKPLNGTDSAEFDADGYSFISESFGQSSASFFSNPEHLRITVIQDTRPKLAAFHKLEGLMLLLAALAMLLGVFAGSFFSRPIANPLIGLASAAESIAEGNLDSAHSMIPQDRMDARDEIGMLERSFVRMVRGLRERLAMATFLSQATYEHICSDAMDGTGANAAVRTSLAVLFSDIRGFTNFSETQDPEAVIELLNQVLSLQAGIVEHHGGDINKFIGDAVFAWFAGDDRSQRAVAAAREIVAVLDAKFAGRPGTQVGIGIHLGELVVGAVGSDDRRDYTAIGSVVNKAARLCAHALQGQILLSKEAAAELNDPTALTPLSPISLKGIADPVPVFEVARTSTGSA